MPNITTVRRLSHSPAFWIVGLFLCAAVASNLTAEENASPDKPDDLSEQTTTTSLLMREGARIESQPVVCRLSGERLAILLDNQERQVLALENLAAQRILTAVMDDSADDAWIITGTVTEYQNANYILLDRVSRGSRR